MKIAILLSALLSFSAMADESEGCVENLYTFTSKTGLAEVTAKNTKDAIDLLNKEEKNAEKCKALGEIEFQTRANLSLHEGSRMALLNALIVCEDMSLKKKAIANLDWLYNSSLSVQESRTYYGMIHQQLGCDK